MRFSSCAVRSGTLDLAAYFVPLARHFSFFCSRTDRAQSRGVRCGRAQVFRGASRGSSGSETFIIAWRRHFFMPWSPPSEAGAALRDSRRPVIRTTGG